MREAHGLLQTSQVHIIVPLAATGSFLDFRLATRAAVRLSSKADMAFEQHCLQTLLSLTLTYTRPPRFEGLQKYSAVVVHKLTVDEFGDFTNTPIMKQQNAVANFFVSPKCKNYSREPDHG